jgi:hypothetical protein
MRTVVLLAFLGLALGLPTSATAQILPNQQGGVAVNAEGVLQLTTQSDPGGRLMRERIDAAKATLNPDVTKPTVMRKISLNRLEEAIRARGGVPTDEMLNLAGLLRLRYVFLYPETKDIVIAGPAEGWVTDMTGRVVGMTSGRPIVPLQDLVVALRAFGPGKRGAGMIGCSIDPTQEGLAEMQRFLRSVGSRAVPGQTMYIVNGLRTSLGMQTVSIQGVPPNTHFAQVMVEADYRMKLIGIGLERPPVRLISWVERASPSQVSRNALQRWYFVPDYNCVRVTEDRTAMELVGDGVKLIGADELVTADGQRQTSTQSNAASQAFVTSFTEKYSELADRSPIYAQLRNLIDLAVAAAFIQNEDYYGKADWHMELLGNERGLAVETLNAPKEVATAVNAIWKGQRLMTPIGGGVSIQAKRALDPSNLLPDENGKVSQTRKESKLNLAKGQWWWN